MQKQKKEDILLGLIRDGRPMSRRQRFSLIARLSIPSILAQLSGILMVYIDASMVGSLGTEASASIGLVSTTTWLFNGLCVAIATSFSVQVAHFIGANDTKSAKEVLRQAFFVTGLCSLCLAGIGVGISNPLPEHGSGRSGLGYSRGHFLHLRHHEFIPLFPLFFPGYRQGNRFRPRQDPACFFSFPPSETLLEPGIAHRASDGARTHGHVRGANHVHRDCSPSRHDCHCS